MTDPADKVNLVKSLTGKRLEAALAQMVVLIDTREPKEGDDTRGKPWKFPDHVLTKRQKLDEGDYAIENYHTNGLVFERKTVPDFLSTLVTGKDRFERECERLAANHDYSFVVVEGSFRDIYECWKTDHPLMKWSQMRGLICRMFLNSHTRVIMAGNAANAVDIAYTMMKLYFKDKIRKAETEPYAVVWDGKKITHENT